MQDNNNKFFTIQEAADFLKVSKTSLRRWSNSGRLPSYRVGNRNERRFLLNDLLDFLSNSETTEPSSNASSRSHQTPTANQKTNASPHHISSYYHDETEQWYALAPYLAPHLNDKARTLYIHDSDTETITQQFLKHGYDPEALQRHKTLNLISSEQSYLLDGVFIPDRMLNFWQQHIGQAMMDGIEKILLTGEMGWALRGLPGSHLLCNYEIELDKFLKNFPMVTVVCQYPLKAFPGDIIFDSICAHPHLQVNDRLVSGIEI
ncbi:MAG TPA: helix-turn-helix domain-containing protein [Methylococcaceae bacterium]|nr:helix-turn-helix domain-containing protein [Methylococcaceae bacterium]HIA44603.1 helix-turn-helix domain-containing protein [Methylococcaceae bacterium]